MLNLLEYAFRRLRQLRIDPALLGLAAGITVLCFLWKKGKRLLFTLLALGLLLRQAEQAARRKEEGHV